MVKDIRGDISFEEWTEAGETLPRLDCEALEAVSTHGRSRVPILMADVLVSWGGCVNAAQGAIGLQSHWRRADLSSLMIVDKQSQRYCTCNQVAVAGAA